jgi:thiamine pyrophosphokinase
MPKRVLQNMKQKIRASVRNRKGKRKNDFEHCVAWNKAEMEISFLIHGSIVHSGHSLLV